MFARKEFAGLIRLMVACGLLLLGANWLTARAQSASNPAPPQPTPNDRRNDQVDFGSREFDTRTRLILKEAKKNHEEHVERAKEASNLAAELQKIYETNRLFNAADYKKLERLEKLTRRIRNEVGGSGTDGDPRELPKSIDAAVVLVATMAKELAEEVENTPRRIVSTSIIDQANKLIAVIQFLRGPRN